MWKKSLKARLALCILLPVTVALGYVGYLSYYHARKAAEEIYDTELSHVATLTDALLSAEDEEELSHAELGERERRANPDILDLGRDFDNNNQSRERHIAFRIWKDNTLLYYSHRAVTFGDQRTNAGYSYEKMGDQEWRMFVLIDSINGYTFEVAQDMEARNHLIASTLRGTFAPLLVLWPVLLGLTLLGLRVGLTPLLNISNAVRSRSAADLTPIPHNQKLEEISPLTDAINSLLQNLHNALQKERRFTDFAAHELRTPIAIFKTQAQSAMRAETDQQRRPILEAQVKAADRATAMVDQLLALARLEQTDLPAAPTDLCALLKSLVEERQPLAEEKSQLLTMSVSDGSSLLVPPDLLSGLLSNLIDNALKYTPPGGIIEVGVETRDARQFCWVRANGPGVPAEKIPFLTDQFYRVGGGNQSGSGLGLTIAKRAAEILGAALILRNRPNGAGFEARVEFSAP